MGISASLFYSAVSGEVSLDRRIRPSEEQFSSQRARWRNLRDYLKGELADKTSHSITSWLQGSYKFGTQIRPASAEQEFDIDLGVYFQWEGSPEDGEFEPAQLKHFVQNSLSKYAQDVENDAKDVDQPKARCNRIHFLDSFHIDVPSYHLDQTRDVRALATEENEWEESDPKAIYIWWKDVFDDSRRDQARRLVRYFKMWAALRFPNETRPSSILLTVLVANAYSSINTVDLSGDDEHFNAVTNAIIDQLEKTFVVPNPVAIEENLNRLSTSASRQFLEALHELSSISGRALETDTKLESADIWSEVFEHFFPIPEETKDVSEHASALKVFDRQPSFNPVVYVRAVKGEKVYKGTNRIGPIPKDCEITFTLSNGHELPEGAKIIWIVRNEGAEAENLNDLGHRKVEAHEITEHSAYLGSHSMDLSVRLNGKLLALKRIPVEITGLPRVVRNPRRPNWVKFRKGR